MFKWRVSGFVQTHGCYSRRHWTQTTFLQIDPSRKLPVLNGSWIKGQANSAII